MLTVGCDLVGGGAFALFELVDQLACLEPVGGWDEADAAAAGELFDEVELAWGSGVVCGHGFLLVGAGWSRKPRPAKARCHAPVRARKPVRVDAG